MRLLLFLFAEAMLFRFHSLMKIVAVGGFKSA